MHQMLLTLNSVTKTFGLRTPNETTVIDELTLHVKKGEFISILGGNGSGKSTLLNLIAGIERPDAGRIELEGKDTQKLSLKQLSSEIGRVFQDPKSGTAGNLTIQENLAIASRRGLKNSLRRGVTAGAKKLFREALAELGLGLENRLTTPVDVLSGGQRQVLTLLMATLRQPTLLLLDEHTAALDPATSRMVSEMTDRIVEMHSQTTLMVTHNVDYAIEYGSRLIMLSRGKIAADVSGEEKKLLKKEDVLALYHRDEAEDLLLQVATGAREEHYQKGRIAGQTA
jgi:putative ABC transport system ATP-binding protein